MSGLGPQHTEARRQSRRARAEKKAADVSEEAPSQQQEQQQQQQRPAQNLLPLPSNRKLRVRGDVFMVVPSQLGDPVLDFDLGGADPQGPVLATGTALGVVNAWQIDHIVPSRPAGASGSRSDVSADSSSLPRLRGGPQEYRCNQLCARSDEGVHAVFFMGPKVFAAVGDLHIKMWPSVRDSEFTTIKFHRTHNYSICTHSYTMYADGKVFIAARGNAEAYEYDLASNEHRKYGLRLPTDSMPVFYDGQWLCYVETLGQGDRLLTVCSFSHNELPVWGRMSFPKPARMYWGFQISGSRMVVVSAHDTVKVYDLSKLRGPAEQKEAKNATDSDSTFVADNKQYLHKFRTNGIVSVLFHKGGTELICMCSDRKIKVWNVVEGRSVKTYLHIEGKFSLGMPYVLKVFPEHDLLLYTADDGVYGLRL